MDKQDLLKEISKLACQSEYVDMEISAMLYTIVSVMYLEQEGDDGPQKELYERVTTLGASRIINELKISSIRNESVQKLLRDLNMN